MRVPVLLVVLLTASACGDAAAPGSTAGAPAWNVEQADMWRSGVERPDLAWPGESPSAVERPDVVWPTTEQPDTEREDPEQEGAEQPDARPDTERPDMSL
ncbi:hypothetical protein AB0K48_60535 [Nonomuraea sp. NPDC055795]